jgi:outer membrane protein TolC
LAACLIGAAGGCAPNTFDPDVSNTAAHIAGLNEPIDFQSEGEPIDVPPVNGSTDGPALGIADAVRRALTHDPGIQAAMARVRVAQADAKQSRLLPNPVLSVVLRWPEGGGKPDIEAGLAADLISLLSRPGRVSVTDNRLRASAAEVLTTTLDVLADVQSRYVAVQANDQLLVVLEDRVRILDRLHGIARARLDAGEGTRLDLLALDAQRVELQTELTDRRLEHAEQRLGLARVLGEPSSVADWQLSAWEAVERPVAVEAMWVNAALANRPEVGQQRFALAALGQEVRLTTFTPFDGGDIGVDAERDGGNWSVGPGVSLPVPLFDFGQARRERARATVIEARHNLTRVSREVVEETRRSYAALKASRENRRRVESELIPITERRLQQAESQFRGGQTDITGLLLAEEQLRAARTRLVELQQRNAEALIRLERAVGGPAAVDVLDNAATRPAAQPTTAAATRSAADSNPTQSAPRTRNAVTANRKN